MFDFIKNLLKPNYDYNKIIEIISRKVEEKIGILNKDTRRIYTRSSVLLSQDLDFVQKNLWQSTLNEIQKVDDCIANHFLEETIKTKGGNIRESNRRILKAVTKNEFTEDFYLDAFEGELYQIRKKAELIKENQIKSENEVVLQAIIFVATASYFSQFQIGSYEKFLDVYKEVLKKNNLTPLMNI